MAIVYSTSFAGIADDQAVDAFDATWAAHPLSVAVLRGYNGADQLESYGTTAGRALYYNTSSGVMSDCKVEMDVTIRTTRFEHGACARLDPAANSMYSLRTGGTGVQLVRVVNGTFGYLGTDYAHTFVAGNTYKLGVRCVGNQIYGMLDGVDVIGPITDSSHASGYPGIRSINDTSAQTVIETFSVDNLGDPPDPTPPQGTVTISNVSPSTTSALVTYGYSAADQTGFEYRLDGGAAASIGASPATISGLTAGAPYSIEIRAINVDGEGAWSTPFNFTTSATGDAENPTLTGSVTFASITQTSYTASWLAGLDNVAITGYEYQIGSTAGAWTDAGNNLSASITGRTAGTTETVYVRAYDAAGLRSTTAISGSVPLLSASADGTITVGSALYPIKYSSASVLNESGLRATVLDATTLAEVLNTSGVVCTNGVITITDAALVIGNTYHLAVKTANGWLGVSDGVTAS